MNIADYFGLIASILLPIIPIPQIWRICSTKTAKDVSIYYILMQIIANTCFMIFGIMKHEVYVIIPNALLIFMNIIMILIKLYFDKYISSNHVNPVNLVINENIMV